MIGVHMNWADNWSAIFSITAPFVLTWIMWTAKKWVESVVNDLNTKMDERTKPIQPNANGGKSLPDAISLLATVDGKLDRVHDRIDDLHEKVNDVARDFEHLKGRFDQHMEDSK